MSDGNLQPPNGGVIEVRGQAEGYCDQCRLPAAVLVLQLAGWKHTWRVCGTCLDRLAAIVRRYEMGG